LAVAGKFDLDVVEAGGGATPEGHDDLPAEMRVLEAKNGRAVSFDREARRVSRLGKATALLESLADATGYQVLEGKALFADGALFKLLAPRTGKTATGRSWSDASRFGVIGTVETALDPRAGLASCEGPVRLDLEVGEDHRLDAARRPAVDVPDAAERRIEPAGGQVVVERRRPGQPVATIVPDDWRSTLPSGSLLVGQGFRWTTVLHARKIADCTGGARDGVATIPVRPFPHHDIQETASHDCPQWP